MYLIYKRILYAHTHTHIYICIHTFNHLLSSYLYTFNTISPYQYPFNTMRFILAFLFPCLELFFDSVKCGFCYPQYSNLGGDP